MPIYNFECGHCDNVEDHLMTHSESNEKRHCHKCGGLMHKTVGGNTDFRLRGQGWYESDYKTSGRKKLLLG